MLPASQTSSGQEGAEFLDRTIYKIIAERRASGVDNGDLLSMLLLSVDEEGSGGMTDKQVRDEALTLFLAGHETTATALTWTWYLLSQNPKWKKKCAPRSEQFSARDCRDTTIFPSSATRKWCSPSRLRLYPPVWAIGREVKSHTRIYNYEVPKGAICLMSPYVMHRNPKFFPEPERFDPNRFTPRTKQNRPKFAYFPFGGGPRVCIGERFAWMEGVLLLATIAQRWRFSLFPNQKIEPHPQITLRTRHGVKMILRPAS